MATELRSAAQAPAREAKGGSTAFAQPLAEVAGELGGQRGEVAGHAPRRGGANANRP